MIQALMITPDAPKGRKFSGAGVSQFIGLFQVHSGNIKRNLISECLTKHKVTKIKCNPVSQRFKIFVVHFSFKVANLTHYMLIFSMILGGQELSISLLQRVLFISQPDTHRRLFQMPMGSIFETTGLHVLNTTGTYYNIFSIFYSNFTEVLCAFQ